jgi:hypothetical protein
MGRGILRAQLRRFDEVGRRVEKKSTWERREGFNRTYEYADAIKSTFGIFLFQHLSMLSYQDSLNRGNQRKNAENILNVKEIPCNNQIKRLLDVIEPEEFDGNFKIGIEQARKYGVLEQYRVLDGGFLIAIDGVWFESSGKVHCDHCLHMTKDGKTTYYHSMTAAVIVRPGGEVVIPVMPEMIRNEDKPKEGNEEQKDDKKPAKVSNEKQKQDCERSAAKRLLEKQGEYYKELKATLLGDDLYANHNTCKDILERGLSFIFTCKDESHPWIAEQFKWSEPETLTITEWTGKTHIEYRYKWVNGIENRADGEKLLVNYIDFEVYERETDKIIYKNSWITNKVITKDTVRLLVDCARARWKIENENNNVLKNYGYNLEHNFGHGENRACEIFCIMNVLAFLVHGLMLLCDENFIKARSYFGRRDEFYNALRTIFWLFEFQSWEDFLNFVITRARGG